MAVLYTRETAVRRALAAVRNEPATCQKWTREIFGAPSAGDRDLDGDADAVDGWLSEPPAHRHVGDRKPPPGVPVSFAGGSRGFGHRAVSLGRGLVRSTDMSDGKYKRGFVGNCTIADLEREMSLTYLGWSNTITGLMIPMELPKREVLPPGRGTKVDSALASLLESRKLAKPGSVRATALDRAIKLLTKIPQR